MEEKEIKKAVRKGYAKIAKQQGSCCAPAASCCGGADPAHEISKKIGYSEEDLKSVPEGTDLGLGCGNPIALASLREGETVLDLGSGPGLDCFLAAKKVGKSGRVIGVDMTPEMIEKARENAEKGNYKNVEFRLGEIENLPVADNSVDAIISNCVINLVPDKARVFREAFRVLKPNGRLMVSDIVLLKELPAVVKESVEAYVGCLSGAIMKADYIAAIKTAGFQDVNIVDESFFAIECALNDPTAKAIIKKLKIPPKELKDIERTVASVKVHGTKPKEALS
jgi:ubiquinone/menaquinone biosynthesis C-methylase UbiE